MRQALIASVFCTRSAILILALSLTGIGACGHQEEAPSPGVSAQRTAVSPTVQVVAARVRQWPFVVRAQGNLVGDEHAVIGAKVAGRVQEVKVDLGSQVEAGQVLAVLEPEDFDLQVEQAEAQLAQDRASLGLRGNDPESKLDRQKSPPVLQEKAVLEEARLNVERARELIRRKVITTEQLEQRESLLRVAQARFSASLNAVEEKITLLAVRRAELAMARQTKSDSVIVAPFTAVVQQRYIGPGVYVNVGDPIAALVRTNPLRFRAGIPERSAARITVGQKVRISVEGQDQPISATVSRVSPSLDLASRSLVIEADVANSEGSLRTGLFAEADIVIAADETALTVPLTAVTEFAGIEKVWVVRNNEAAEQPIRTGRREEDFVEVLEGVKAGEMVIAQSSQGQAGPVRIGPGESAAAQVGVAGTATARIQDSPAASEPPTPSRPRL